MNYSLFDLLKLLGALGFFIYGMKIMSEGIQKAAGQKLRETLGAMTKNRFFGVMTGFVITGIIQSSSATTVMTVSFVNAGLLTLMQSAGVMMGANIGTTVTGWLVSYLGFKVEVAAISLPLIAVGLPMMLLGNSTIKNWGEFIIGFAILFLGLDALKDTVPNLKENPEVLSFIAGFEFNIGTSLLFVLIGAVMTMIIQSSSAAMTLTFVLCNNGWISFPMAAALVLGENIGTTITAELASLAGNVHAKRSARIHSMFNILGVSWMIWVLPYVLQLISWFSQSVMGNTSPYVDAAAIPFALSYFHTFFNVINVLIQVWLIPLHVKIATATVPSKGELDEVFHLEYIGTGMMGTAELSILEAKKEVTKFGELTRRHVDMTKDLLLEKDKKKMKKLVKRIMKYEEISDRIEVEVTQYLTKVSTSELSKESSLLVRAMLSVISDLEKVSDICYQMSIIIDRKQESKIWFSADQRKELLDLFEKVDSAGKQMCNNLEKNYSQIDLAPAETLEEEINSLRDLIRKHHLANIEKGEYSFQNGMIYSDLFSSLERIGDHFMSVNKAMAGKV